MKREKIIIRARRSAFVKALIFISFGILVGWMLFHTPGSTVTTEGHDHEKETTQPEIWTCSMHPQFQLPDPGKCPICAMDLIPLIKGGEVSDPGAIKLSVEALALANVHTSVVGKAKPVRKVRLYGTIQPDERLMQSQPSHIPGRIEQLLVNFTGEQVKKGQPLATIYSPELINAQQDLLEAMKMKDVQPAILEAARERLRQWKLSSDQIASIEQSGTVTTEFPVLAGTSGIVMGRRVNVGDYVNRGTVLFDITDLSKLWVLFDAYEQDIAFIRIGDKITYTLQAMPGKRFEGRVTFVDPFVDQMTRVAKVRVEVSNSNGALKPAMFVTGLIEARLDEYRNNMVIPRSAVLWTGKRSVVYVKLPEEEEPAFRLREITLGPKLGNSYVVVDGLEEGEEIVTDGTFSVDAAAQLEGKPSMMNPSGGKVSTGHDHGAMIAEGTSSTMEMESEKVKVDQRFTKQFKSVYDHYLQMSDAFVDSDPDKVTQQSAYVLEALKKTEMKYLKGAAHDIWMKQLPALEKALDKIRSSDDLEVQREAYAGFNLAFYKVLKAFGLEGDTAYYQYCPMALGDKGAYWFSDQKEIRNPYFGDAMLKCGETRETLK